MTGNDDYMALVVFSKIYWKIWKIKSKVFINYFLSGHLLCLKSTMLHSQVQTYLELKMIDNADCAFKRKVLKHGTT